MTQDGPKDPAIATTPAMVTIRIARASDVAGIVRLLWDDDQGMLRESVAEADAPSYLDAFDQISKDPNSTVFVAEDDGLVIGCVQVTIIPGLSYRGVRRALIEDVRVERRLRGGGIGQRLLAHAEHHAVQAGCGLMELFVHGDRAKAHRFYERAGYVGAHRGYRKPLV